MQELARFLRFLPYHLLLLQIHSRNSQVLASHSLVQVAVLGRFRAFPRAVPLFRRQASKSSVRSPTKSPLPGLAVSVSSPRRRPVFDSE